VDFEGASATEKTGAWPFTTPSPCPLPLGSGGEGANSSPRGEVATRPAATEGVGPFAGNTRPPQGGGCAKFRSRQTNSVHATSPFGRGRSGLSESDSDLSARPGEGIGNSGYPLPNPLPEGEGAISGVHNSSPPEGEVPRYEAEGVSNFEGITPPPSSHSASLTQSHLLPKEEDLHIQSPSLGEGEVRGLRGQGAGSVESTEPSSVHPPHPSPLPLGSGGSLPHLAAALKAKFGTLERGPLTRAIYACASPQAELGGMIGVLGQDVAESEELQHEVNEHFRPLLETACRLTTAREIGLVGGVWDAHPIFLDLITDLTKVLNVPYENVTISKTDASPAMGAVRLAMKLHSNEYRRS